MNAFSNLSLSTLLHRNLVNNGFKQMTPIQASAIEPGMAGSDLVATAQTGTGKTLAFVLPVLHRLAANPDRAGVRAVVLTPTRELALQIGEVFSAIGAGTRLKSTVVVGGLGEGPQLKSIRQGSQILIATPGRLLDFLQRRLVDLGTLEILTLDEADRMLDMGFLPAIRSILAACPRDRQTMLFSATMEPSVRQLIQTHVRNPLRIEIGSTNQSSDRVDLHLYEVEQNAKLALLERMLREEDGTFLVFARTKHGTDRLAKQLSRSGIKSAAIHGNRTQNQRSQALRGFQSGSYRVLVATDVAARGIHIDAISQVVNFDLPQAPEDFIHRVGRTGRAGARGTATTFATRSQRAEVARIERVLGVGLRRRQVDSDVSFVPEVTVTMAAAAPVSAPKPRVQSFAPRRRRG